MEQRLQLLTSFFIRLVFSSLTESIWAKTTLASFLHRGMYVMTLLTQNNQMFQFLSHSLLQIENHYSSWKFTDRLKVFNLNSEIFLVFVFLRFFGEKILGWCQISISSLLYLSHFIEIEVNFIKILWIITIFFSWLYLLFLGFTI